MRFQLELPATQESIAKVGGMSRMIYNRGGIYKVKSRLRLFVYARADVQIIDVQVADPHALVCAPLV